MAECVRCRNTDVDKPLVTELVLVITNDGDLYRSRITPIIRNLRRHRQQGKYDHEKALKLWSYLVDDYARKYAKENNLNSRDITHADRHAVARELADHYHSEIFSD